MTTAHEIEVDGREFRVLVGQKSKTVWRAYGMFDDEQIDVTGESEHAALSAWRARSRLKMRE